ncbi:hypothetical protein P3T40_002632 [Paraburkholderia sp. EB58]|jgi:hypothetical protein
MLGEPQVRDGQGRGKPTRSRENTTRTCSFIKRTRFVMLIVALMAVVAVAAGTAGETNAFAVPVPDDVSQSASALPSPSPHSQHCALKYAAVLDLAELARRDGKSSSAYQHAFNRIAGEMNDCGSGARYVASSSVAVEAAAGAGSAAYE